MKWAPLIVNLVAALGFIAFPIVATNIHATHAYSTYHGLVDSHVIVEHPVDAMGKPYDVEMHLRRIGGVEFYYNILGFAAAAACIINGLLLSRQCRKSLPS